MSRVLILSLVFPPDSVSTAHIMGDLARDLQASGHTVTVLTTTPHYNFDAEAEARQPRRPYWGRLLQTSDYHGVRVYHTWMPRKGKSIAGRLLSWLLFHVLSTAAGLFVLRKQDLIIAPSPPLTIGVGAWLIGMLHRAPYIYNVQEIYPDMAIRLGAVRNPLLIRMLYRLERFVYRRAGSVTTIAPGMRRTLISKGVPPEKAHLIPNFVDVREFRPLPRENSFRRHHGLKDKFVVSYAGNMGIPQGLDTFVDAALLLRDHPQIHFLMLGDGSHREHLARRIAEAGLDNSTMLPYQPVSTIPAVYAASDLCLVPLDADSASDAVPSKVYRIMACARAVLAVAKEESDLGQLVREASCGMVVPPGSARALADAILAGWKSPAELEQMGRRGEAHVREHFSRAQVTRRYNALVEQLAEDRRCAA